MRPWMIGVVLGILPVGLLPALPPPSVAILVGAGSLLAITGRSPRWYLVAGIGMGCALALVYGQQLLEHRFDENCAGESVSVTGVIASLPRHSLLADDTPRQRFEFQPENFEPAACGGPRKIVLSYYGRDGLVPGQRWHFAVRLSRPWGLANPGSFNMQAWYALTGIDAVGSVRGGRGRLLGWSSSPLAAVDRLRQSVSERIRSLRLREDSKAVLQAVTVADKSGIDGRFWTLLQRYGVNHLLVVSGLHVALVAGAGYLLGTLVARVLLLAGLYTLWLPAVSGLLCAAGYAALAGMSVSTQRALCMLACFSLAHLARRESHSANNLLLSALLVLFINPLAPLGSGFWLSFGAVAALLWLARWETAAGRWRRLLATHLFMSLAMLPVGGWWFGGASLVAAPANLLMVPVVGMLVVPLALLGTLAFFLELGVEPLLWQLAAWPLEQLLPLAREADAAGGRWMYLQCTPGVLQLCLAISGVAMVVLPGSRILRALGILLLLPALLPRLPHTANDPATALVTVLDVGQGTAVVVISGERALLYDTGGGDPAGANMASAVVLPYLWARGIRELDTMVISHGDRDHSAGAATVLEAVTVGRLRYGAGFPAGPDWQPCAAGEAWRWPGGVRFQFLSPARESPRGTNDGSCVLRIQIGAYTLLLPGDIESDQERELVRYWGETLESDWLLAGHHGSQTSSSRAWLKHVRPQTVIINRGFANRFGHPHPDVVSRLAQSGAQVLDTALAGALEFEFDPASPPRVSAYRERKRRFWM